MKKMNLSLSLVAVFLGIGLALTHSAPVKAAKAGVAVSWFTYNGAGSVTDPANYTQVSGTPDCPGTTIMCAIQATVGTGSKPVITSSLSSEINFDLAHQTDSGNVSLRD
jgi:hypothetical protein